jgi:hypothetical protein
MLEQRLAKLEEISVKSGEDFIVKHNAILQEIGTHFLL